MLNPSVIALRLFASSGRVEDQVPKGNHVDVAEAVFAPPEENNPLNGQHPQNGRNPLNEQKPLREQTAGRTKTRHDTTGKVTNAQASKAEIIPPSWPTPA